jgi:hypothetical protein
MLCAMCDEVHMYEYVVQLTYKAPYLKLVEHVVQLLHSFLPSSYGFVILLSYCLLITLYVIVTGSGAYLRTLWLDSPEFSAEGLLIQEFIINMKNQSNRFLSTSRQRVA